MAKLRRLFVALAVSGPALRKPFVCASQSTARLLAAAVEEEEVVVAAAAAAAAAASGCSRGALLLRYLPRAGMVRMCV